MPDFKMNNEGCVVFENNDLIIVDNIQILKQKIYRCLMKFNPESIIGKIPDTQEEANLTLRAYLSDYFTTDNQINVEKFNVELQIDDINKKAYAVLEYIDNTSSQNISIVSDMKYSIEKQGLVTVDSMPKWLSVPYNENEKDIIQYIKVKEFTNRVKLKHDYTSGPVYLYIEDRDVSNISYTDIPFIINIHENRINYNIGNYTEGYNPLVHVIDKVVMTNATVDYTLDLPEIKCIKQKGLLEGSITIREAVAKTEDVRLDHTHDQQPVFPLHNVRGIYYAQFPGGINPGKYKLVYKGRDNANI